MNYCYKKLVGVITLALAAMPMTALADAQQAVVVVSADGSSREIALPEIARIDIADGGLTLHSRSGESSEIPYGSLDRVIIGAEFTAVDKVLGKGDVAVWPTLVTTSVNVAGLAEGTTVNVYTVGGQLFSSSQADSDGRATIDMTRAAAGIYVVAAGNHSVKVVKN